MHIPKTFTFKLHTHGSGENGYAVFEMDDECGLGIMLQSKRSGSIQPYVETWSLRALPNQIFSSLVELRAAASGLTDQDIAAEAGKYPAMRPIMRDTIGNRCRLCPRELQLPTGNNTYRVKVATCWAAARDVTISLCADHTAEYHDHPAALLLALDAEKQDRTMRNQSFNNLTGATHAD